MNNVFYALTTESRRNLLDLLLQESELSLIQLSYRLRSNVAAVSYDLGVLIDTRLVTEKAVGVTDLEFTYHLRYREHVKNLLEANKAISK